jgi:hypothetical protein
MRYVPMPPELADELRRFTPQLANNVLYIAGNNHEWIFPPKKDAKGERQRVEGSLTIYSKEPGSKISVSTICVTRLHRGTARDGIEPPTPAFQGRIPNRGSGLKSTDPWYVGLTNAELRTSIPASMAFSRSAGIVLPPRVVSKA